MSDKMLCAPGRSANIENLGLAAVGILQGKYGMITVDAHYETNVPGIYAVGNVIRPPALASTSMEQGRRAVSHALGRAPGSAFAIVPTCI